MAATTAPQTAPSTAPVPASARGHVVVGRPDERRLRVALRLDGTGSVLCGVVALAAAGWLGDRMDVPAWTVAVAGASFVAFGAELWWASSRRVHRLPAAGRWVAAANALYVVVTVALLVAGVFSTWGAVVMGLAGLWAADMAVAQWWFARRLDGR